MHGLMMDYPLSIPAVVRRAETLFGDRMVASRRPDRTVARASYAAVIERSRRLGVALRGLGIQPGDRVATLACSSQQHLEAYLAIPSIGAVLHTLNLRLHHDASPTSSTTPGTASSSSTRACCRCMRNSGPGRRSNR